MSSGIHSSRETALYVGNAVKNLLTLVVGSIVLILSASLRCIGEGMFFAWDWAMDKSGRKRVILDRESKEPYLVRYYLLFKNRNSSFPFNVFIHRFIKGDDDHVHDHPWGYFTYILNGGYHETVWSDGKKCTHWRAPGFYQKVGSHHTHKITLDPQAPSCWTLFVPFRRSREWGFYTKNSKGKTIWTSSECYLKKLHGAAKSGGAALCGHCDPQLCGDEQCNCGNCTSSDDGPCSCGESSPSAKGDTDCTPLRTRSQTQLSKKEI